MAQVQDRRNFVDGYVHHCDTVGRRFRADGRRDHVTVVRVRQRYPERCVRTRSVAEHRPIRAAGPVRRRRRNTRRQDRPVLRKC